VSDISGLAAHPDMTEALKRGFQESILNAHNRLELEQIKAIPSKFMISAIYAPRFGISHRHRYFLPKNSKQLLDWAEEGFPGVPRRMTESRITRPLESLAGALTGYLAMSFDAKYKKTRELVKTDFRSQLKVGLPPDTDIGSEQLFYDAEEAPGMLGADLDKKFLEGIRRAYFFTADVAMPIADVYMEVGIAHGLMKPSYLVWNLKAGSFSRDAMPRYLRNQEVMGLHLTRATERRKLTHRVTRDLSQLALSQVCPIYKPMTCKFHIEKQPRTMFVVTANQTDEHRRVFEGFQTLLSKELKLEQVNMPPGSLQSELCSCCYAIRSCSYCVIDVTGPPVDLGNAWACGLAYATGPERLLRTYLQGTKCDEPTMSLALEPCAWNPLQEGRDVYEHFRGKFQI
jgi:hypothetical protein